jgi:hypothetical protein
MGAWQAVAVAVQIREGDWHLSGGSKSLDDIA